MWTHGVGCGCMGRGVDSWGGVWTHRAGCGLMWWGVDSWGGVWTHGAGFGLMGRGIYSSLPLNSHHSSGPTSDTFHQGYPLITSQYCIEVPNGWTGCRARRERDKMSEEMVE